MKLELNNQQAKFLEEIFQHELQEDYLSNFARKTYVDVLEKIRIGLEASKLPQNEF